MDMKTNLKSSQKNVQLLLLLMIATVFSCTSNSGSKPTDGNTQTSKNTKEYFSVKIDGVLWEAFPSKEFKAYNVSYKELGHQFSIFAEAEDGSRMDVSFHSATELKPGNYPSTRNDNGMLSGVFYFPEAKSSDKEMASTTFEYPVQENTVQLLSIDKSDKKAYVIEGTFSPTLHAVYETNPKKSSKLTEGKFKVIYRPDAMNPAF